jgi:septal ring factor EnvC (AmiA/AmiB activator)
MEDERVMQEAPTPKLNLRRLESIQRWLQYGAVLVLLIFIALIAVAWFKLRGIKRNISNANVTLNQKKTEIDELQKNINALEAQKKDLKAQVAEKDTVIRAIDPTIDPKTGEHSQLSSSQIQARIYIQIGNEGQRKRAADVANQLQAKGYIVPGIENVQGRAGIPTVTQLRYYQTDSVAQSDVKDITTFLRGIGINLDLPPPIKIGKVRPRHYELWFSPDF